MAADAGRENVSHQWKFLRTAGFDQVSLKTGSDLAALAQLDQKLWATLSCPTNGLEFDQQTLNSIDTDKDGRIRVVEILSAVRWALSLLKNSDELLRGTGQLALNEINDGTAEGKQLLASARQVLINLGKADTDFITVADTSDTVKIFAGMEFNGDGIVPAMAADDEAVAQVIIDIIACLGGEPDRSGQAGISQAKADEFFAKIKAYVEWRSKAEVEAANILPLGDATAAAYEALQAVRNKTDDYFARCRLAAYDPRAAVQMNRSEADYANLAGKDLSAAAEELASFPLALIEPMRPLPLAGGVNPAFASAIAKLREAVVVPLLGEQDALSSDDWDTVKGKLSGYQTWVAAKAGAEVEKLGIARIREILAGNSSAAIADLIARDKALEPEANAFATVDKILHYHRDLYRLLHNFINLQDFYSQADKAIFQAGTLYLDCRSFDLCVKVADMKKHGDLAGLSKSCLLYCDCTRRGATDKMTIVAAVTNGDVDYLMVGRNGVFYDRLGQDWDATVVKIIDNPISIRQAFWSPYKKVAKLIEEQIGKMATAREKAVEDKAAAGVGDAGAKLEAGKAGAPPPFDVGKFAGIFAAIGLAVGAIGTALAAMVTGLLSLAWWQLPLALAGMMLVVSGPSMLLAWLKLRQRNLAPILEANGWAVNARAKINVPFGASLTSLATLPPGSERALHDPYAEKQTPWGLYLTLLVVIVAAVLFWRNGMLSF